MTLWYAREGYPTIESRRFYIIGYRKLYKHLIHNGVYWATVNKKPPDYAGTISVCPDHFEKLHPKSMHLALGEGPYRLKPLERA